MYTVREVAERLGVSERTIRNYGKQRRIRLTRISRGVVRIAPDELERFLASCDEPAAPPLDLAPVAAP